MLCDDEAKYDGVMGIDVRMGESIGCGVGERDKGCMWVLGESETDLLY